MNITELQQQVFDSFEIDGQLLPAVILLSSMAGSIIGIGMILFAKHGRNAPIPFGPYLALGGIAALFFGPQLARLYLGG